MSRGGVMDQSVDAALKLIDTVTATADIVCVNKNQCQRLAQRFDAIRKALPRAHDSSNGGSVDSGSEAPSTMEVILPLLLKVLGDGEVLVRSYADEREALRNVLYRAENVDAFKEVHGEIDTLETYLDFKDPSSSSEKSNRLLSSDAETDRGQILPQLRSLNLRVLEEDHTGSSFSRDDVLENMDVVITDKCYKADSNAEDLSYLNIPFSAIRLEGAIKELKPLHERKTQRDAHLDGMAIVQKGSWNGVNCAIKVFKSEKSHWNQAELRKEIASLVKLRHPHITQLIGCSQDQEKTYVLYEKMDADLRVCMENRSKKKSLSKVLRGDDRPFSRTEEVSIITQIARGMFYLHEKGYVHGELKCTNLLVKEVGDHIDVKVADFHCSRELGVQEPNTKLYSPAHRPRWMPPEAFDHYNVKQPEDELLKQGDVYSFAMTCYEVVTGKYPFDGVKENLKVKIKAGERPKLPDDLSADLKNLVTKCWDPNPELRPSFQDICYVLKVDAVNLMSQVQKLLANFCLGLGSSCNEPAISDEASETDKPSWTEVLKLKESEVATGEETIDTAAKDLPHYLKIRPFDLKPGRFLGKGASAEVYEANWIGCKFAVKWLKVAHVAKLREETGIMIRLLHPNVIRLVGFSVFKNRCAIVMELMENSLKGFMKSRIEKAKHAVPFSEPDALGIITKLALGMAFLHSRDVAHGDLKCENVLVRNAGNKISRLDVKIVDFGLSHLLQLERSSSRKLRPSRVVGRCRAPEVILRQESMNDEQTVDFDPKAADVYSFASTCFEIITGRISFYEKSDSAAEAITKFGGKPSLPSHVSPDLRQLLDDCWAYPEIAERPKFADIVDRLARMSKCKQ